MVVSDLIRCPSGTVGAAALLRGCLLFGPGPHCMAPLEAQSYILWASWPYETVCPTGAYLGNGFFKNGFLQRQIFQTWICLKKPNIILQKD